MSDHGATTIPVHSIVAQAVNLTLFVGIMIYFLRAKVKAHFVSRKQEFTTHLQRAELELKDAEKKKREISEKIRELEQNAQEGIARARGEAEELRKKILVDAQQISETLERDAARTAEFEIYRAKEEIRNELFSSALSTAKESLKKDIDAKAQKKLQSEFVEKIQVVR